MEILGDLKSYTCSRSLFGLPGIGESEWGGVGEEAVFLKSGALLFFLFVCVGCGLFVSFKYRILRWFR